MAPEPHLQPFSYEEKGAHVLPAVTLVALALPYEGRVADRPGEVCAPTIFSRPAERMSAFQQIAGGG